MTVNRRRLKLMAEVQCWAIWEMDGTENIDPSTLPLPEQLVKEINQWSDRFDAIYKLGEPNFHENIAFGSSQDENAFYDDGWKLLARLSSAMPEVDWWYRDMRLAKVVQYQP